MLIALVCAVLLLTLGVLIGMRVPWGTKQPQVATGVAMRANSDNDLVLFDADDGRQFQFGASRMWWESASAEGEGLSLIHI